MIIIQGLKSEPFATIGRALGFVKTNGETTSIRVADGLYAPSTNGEKYPITLPDNVHLIGESKKIPYLMLRQILIIKKE